MSYYAVAWDGVNASCAMLMDMPLVQGTIRQNEYGKYESATVSQMIEAGWLYAYDCGVHTFHLERYDGKYLKFNSMTEMQAWWEDSYLNPNFKQSIGLIINGGEQGDFFGGDWKSASSMAEGMG